MFAWGAVPVLTMALIGPTALAPVATSPTPVLQQLAGSGGWRTTVVMSGASATAPCPGGPAALPSFTLATVSPAATENATAVTPVTSAGTNICEVTVTFAPLSQVPASATLAYLGTPPITLTVSRRVTAFDYVWRPVLFGVAVALLLALGCLLFVPVYGEKGKKEEIRARWGAAVRASGAWTIGDSWATNIAALVAIVATVLGVSSAASELFPGADIGKFVVVLDIFGAIATAVPLLFAVLYTAWTARRPGLTEDASLWLTATLGRTTTAVLREAAAVQAGRGVRPNSPEPLGQDTSVVLATGSRVMVPGTSPLALARRVRDAVLMPGTVVTLGTGTRVSDGSGHERQLSLPAKARLPVATVVTLPKDTVITPLAATLAEPTEPDELAGLVELVRLPSAHHFGLPAGTRVTLPGDGAVTVLESVAADLADGAAIRLSDQTKIALAPNTEFTVTLPDRTTCMPNADGAKAVVLAAPEGVPARLLREHGPSDPGLPTLDSIKYGSGARLRVTSGATIAVPWGATACAAVIGGTATQPARLDASATISVPPECDIRVYGGYVTVPGTSDVLLRGDCILVIGNNAIDAGTLAVGSGTALGFPVRITVRGGAKISVNGVARLDLPDAVLVTAARRAAFTISAASSRTPIRVPQGTNTLVGPLWAVVAAAVVTTFTVGAQLGLAALLTTYLLGADTLGRSLTWVVAGAIGLFTVWYGVTAIRALADPQPGSSMSSTAGTSFTL